MSFYPIELIFIGWIGDIWKFFWVLRNFEFKPANGIFWQKCKFPAFQKVLFLGVWCRKLSLNKIGVMDMSYIIENKSNRWEFFLRGGVVVGSDREGISMASWPNLLFWILPAASTYFVKAQTAKPIYAFPFLDRGNGPAKSKFKRQNGFGMTGIALSGGNPAFQIVLFL